MQSLVEDCLIHIFSLLPGRELARNVSRVCKQWNRLAMDDSLWKRRYHIDFNTLPLELELATKRETHGLTPTDDRFWRFCYIRRCRNLTEARRLVSLVKNLESDLTACSATPLWARNDDPDETAYSITNQIVQLCHQALALDSEYVPAYVPLLKHSSSSNEDEDEDFGIRDARALMYLAPNKYKAFQELDSEARRVLTGDKVKVFLARLLHCKSVPSEDKSAIYCELATTALMETEPELCHLFLRRAEEEGGKKLPRTYFAAKYKLLAFVGQLDWNPDISRVYLAEELKEVGTDDTVSGRERAASAHIGRTQRLIDATGDISLLGLQHFARALTLSSNIPASLSMCCSIRPSSTPNRKSKRIHREAIHLMLRAIKLRQETLTPRDASYYSTLTRATGKRKGLRGRVRSKPRKRRGARSRDDEEQWEDVDDDGDDVDDADDDNWELLLAQIRDVLMRNTTTKLLEEDLVISDEVFARAIEPIPDRLVLSITTYEEQQKNWGLYNLFQEELAGCVRPALCLANAVASNNVEALEYLLKYDRQIFVDNHRYLGQSCFKHDSAEVLSHLLDSGIVSPDSLELKSGRTLLHLAATHGAAFVAEMLIKRGDDINARDSFDVTPLHVACAAGSHAVAAILLRQPTIDLLCVAKDGTSVLHNAPYHTLKLALFAGVPADLYVPATIDENTSHPADVDEAFKRKRPLASNRNCGKFPELLIEFGANVVASEEDDYLSLMDNFDNSDHRDEIAGLILDKGALYSYGYPDCFQLLLFAKDVAQFNDFLDRAGPLSDQDLMTINAQLDPERPEFRLALMDRLPPALREEVQQQWVEFEQNNREFEVERIRENYQVTHILKRPRKKLGHH